MPALATKQPVRSIQTDVPADLVVAIDQIAAHEMLSRSAWMRRVINNAVKFARWNASLNKQR
jgi:hypothetical protein